MALARFILNTKRVCVCVGVCVKLLLLNGGGVLESIHFGGLSANTKSDDVSG